MNYYKSQISNDIFVRKQRPPMTPCIFNRTMLGNFRIGFESILSLLCNRPSLSVFLLSFLDHMLRMKLPLKRSIEFWKSNK